MITNLNHSAFGEKFKSKNNLTAICFTKRKLIFKLRLQYLFKQTPTKLTWIDVGYLVQVQQGSNIQNSFFFYQ